MKTKKDKLKMKKRTGRREKKSNTAFLWFVLCLVLIIAAITGIRAFYRHIEYNENSHNNTSVDEPLVALVYNGDIAVEVDSNNPSFSDDELKEAQEGGFETYSELDSLGRCGTAIASVCTETMPVEGEKRTSMGSISPSGWQTINFWCRCHLIGWQLTAENANEKNLITGTTRMNMSGMLPYENIIANYIDENPDAHVLYKVEPLFDGKNLVASGVQLQAESAEDRGKGVSFNVYIFNYQPGYIIDYKNGMVEDDPEHQTTITISDKKEAYNGQPITIGDAKVEGSTGDIRYIYYTDKSAKVRTTEADGSAGMGTAPSNRGKYYVRAVVSGDNWYPTAASNVAELVIY